MFSTSLTVIAVTSLLASANLVAQPTWNSDYSKALAQASELHKPVAVFISTGNAGYAKVVDDGINAEAAKLLRSNYVCLYVDTTTEAGKTLAGAFEMKSGIVISDHSGGLQALRHDGKVSQANLANYLEKFSTLKTVQTTEYHSANAPAGLQTFNPMSVLPGYSPAGGCPNGRCPLAR